VWSYALIWINPLLFLSARLVFLFFPSLYVPLSLVISSPTPLLCFVELASIVEASWQMYTPQPPHPTPNLVCGLHIVVVAGHY
jgi:hypothetical protein